MKKSELKFDYPEELVADAPARPTRVMFVKDHPEEITLSETLEKIQPGDCLVLNNSKVEKRRVFGRLSNGEEVEILFAKELGEKKWEVLSPARKIGTQEVKLPEGVFLTITERGRPQVASVNKSVGLEYFERYGEMPLPPYIRSQRKTGHTQGEDNSWYQPVWSEVSGSSAAPTASLHFKKEDIQNLRDQGVHVCFVTLHVGLGTYLPVDTEDLEDFDMHGEWCSLSKESWNQIQETKAKGGRVWVLGTTACRAVESISKGYLSESDRAFEGETFLKILPGHKFQIVDVLMTNFHQPETTLLALVCAFKGVDQVRSAYKWAIERQFRLFSYGDLTVWD